MLFRSMAAAALRALPKGRVSGEQRHDSETPLHPDGIPVRATLEVDPDAGRIRIDLTDNIDNVPLGINLSEATTLAACRVAVVSALGPDVPRATGACGGISTASSVYSATIVSTSPLLYAFSHVVVAAFNAASSAAMSTVGAGAGAGGAVLVHALTARDKANATIADRIRDMRSPSGVCV